MTDERHPTNIYVRFECGSEDRVSKQYGPYDFVQLTYTDLRVGPDGDHMAYYDPATSEWRIYGDARAGTPEGEWWSDVIVYIGADA